MGWALLVRIALQKLLVVKRHCSKAAWQGEAACAINSPWQYNACNTFQQSIIPEETACAITAINPWLRLQCKNGNHPWRGCVCVKRSIVPGEAAHARTVCDQSLVRLRARERQSIIPGCVCKNGNHPWRGCGCVKRSIVPGEAACARTAINPY